MKNLSFQGWLTWIIITVGFILFAISAKKIAVWRRKVKIYDEELKDNLKKYFGVLGGPAYWNHNKLMSIIIGVFLYLGMVLGIVFKNNIGMWICFIVSGFFISFVIIQKKQK